MKALCINFLSLCCFLLGSGSAAAQVLVNCDFEAPYELFLQSVESTFYSPGGNVAFSPIVSIQTVDSGDPVYGNAARVLVDTSTCTNHWLAAWRGQPWAISLPNFDPEHTFFSFDLLVYELHPFYIRIEYLAQNRGMSLEGNVNPTITGVFQRFTLRLTALTNSFLWNQPPNAPTSFVLGLHGDVTQPESSWPFVATNLCFLDNVTYFLSPPLSITSLNNTVTISWPTNCAGFDLQETADPMTGGWTRVTNTVSVVNGQSQIVAPVLGRNFYRLLRE